jgi:hypothetical protein
MIRVVLDTNILISALLQPQGLLFENDAGARGPLYSGAGVPGPIACWASISSTYISSDTPRAWASAANRSGTLILTCINAILACVLKQWRVVRVESTLPSRGGNVFAVIVHQKRTKPTRELC